MAITIYHSRAYNLGYAQCRDSKEPDSLVNPFNQMDESEFYSDWIEGKHVAWYDYHYDCHQETI